jgi:tight adherence protein B
MKKALDTNFKAFGILNKQNDLLTASLVAGITFLLASALTNSLTIGAAFCTLTGAASKQFLKQRKENKQNQLTQVWPDVIDHLVAGLYSGQSITESIADLEYRGPELVRADFANFRKDIKSGLDFNSAINNLRNTFSHHGSDQIFEALQLSKTLGGGELLNTLRTLGSFQREDLMLNKEIAIKHGWIKNSAHISAAAPWVLLLMIGTQSGTAASFASATGMMILIAGVLMTFLAYLWMSKISSLPVAPRVFRG